MCERVALLEEASLELRQSNIDDRANEAVERKETRVSL